MNINTISFKGSNDYPDVPEWFSKAYNQRRTTNNPNTRNIILDKEPNDTLELHNRNNNIKKSIKSNISKGKATAAAIAAVLSSLCVGVSAQTNIMQDKATDVAEQAIVMNEDTEDSNKPEVSDILEQKYTINLKDDSKEPIAEYINPNQMRYEAEQRKHEFEAMVAIKRRDEEAKKSAEEMAILAPILDEKLGAGFSDRLKEVCENINCDMKDIVGLMYSESGLVHNLVNEDSGSVGLIQFMPGTAEAFGTTINALKNMTAREQLDYVEKCILYWKKANDMPSDYKLSAGELYALVFVPAYVNDDVLVYSGMSAYENNTALDIDGDGNIVKEELAERVENKYNEFWDNLETED